MVKRTTISTTITPEFYDLAKRNKIKWNYAIMRGIKAILREEEQKLPEYRHLIDIINQKDALIDRLREKMLSSSGGVEK